jgi:glycosyltransferase involved in cell wall biosynthesis
LSAEDQLPWLRKQNKVEVRVSRVRHYSWQEQTIWLRQLYQAQLDLLYVPHFNVPLGYFRPFVITIHDLLWHTQRDPSATTLSPFTYRMKYWGYRLVSWSALKKALILFTPTHFVADQIQKIIGKTAPVIVTSEGLGAEFLAVEPVGKSKRASKKKERAPYVVYTGSLYPHKNVEVILHALKKMPNVHLVVITSRSVFVDSLRQSIQKLQLEEQVEIYHQLKDSEVISWYQSAIALIQPSKSEGFGLTGIEALSAGCPIIVSDIPVFHEVYGNEAQYFSPDDADQLKELIEERLKQPPPLESRIHSQKFAQSFSWHNAAQKTWEGFLSVLKS